MTIKAAFLQTSAFLILLALALFGPAGRIDLVEFWVYIAIVAVISVFSLAILDADLVAECMRPGGRRVTLRFLPITAVMFLHWAVAGFDRGRLHVGDAIPVVLRIADLVGFAAGCRSAPIRDIAEGAQARLATVSGLRPAARSDLRLLRQINDRAPNWRSNTSSDPDLCAVKHAHKTMHLMMTRTAKTTIAFGLVGALTLLTAIPTWAAPVRSNTAAVKTAAPSQTTEVRYFGHRGFGPGAAIGGLAFGLAGAALAAPYYYDYPGYAYGPNYYGYGYPGYGYPGYAYGPNYYGYGPGYGYAPGPYAWGPRWHRHYRRW